MSFLMEDLNNQVIFIFEIQVSIMYKQQILCQVKELSWIGFYLINVD